MWLQFLLDKIRVEVVMVFEFTPTYSKCVSRSERGTVNDLYLPKPCSGLSQPLCGRSKRMLRTSSAGGRKWKQMWCQGES